MTKEGREASQEKNANSEGVRFNKVESQKVKGFRGERRCKW